MKIIASKNCHRIGTPTFPLIPVLFDFSLLNNPPNPFLVRKSPAQPACPLHPSLTNAILQKSFVKLWIEDNGKNLPYYH